jgi:DNA-binding transcriptional ArsR family regulator
VSQGDEGKRRRERMRAKAGENPTRMTILAALGCQRELSGPDLSAQLPDDVSLRAVNYHLAVLQAAETVACDEGMYSLA